MKSKLILSLMLALGFGWQAYAQNLTNVSPGAYGYYIDALRYSQLYYLGSARMAGMSGAQTALGADAASLVGNPAGLGMYRKSEITLSPSLLFAANNTNYLGNSNRSLKTRFNIASGAGVFAHTVRDFVDDPYRGGAFGIGFTQLNNFHNTYTLKGTNNGNSMINHLTQQANGLFPSQLGGLPGLGFDAFLIDTVPGMPLTYRPVADTADIFPANQRTQMETKGSHYEINLGYGANIQDKLFLGIGIGIGIINYNQTRTYSENTPIRADRTLMNFEHKEAYNHSGAGVNLKLGAIYRPVDAIRLGISIQTPTSYLITEDFTSRLQVNYNNFNYYNSTGPLNSFDYALPPSEDYEFTLVTPFRMAYGMALFFNKNGFISTDLELVLYDNAFLSDEFETDFGPDNQTIENLYRNTFNWRIGGEYRIDPFRLRAGMAYYGDPYNTNDGVNRSQLSFSAGAGFRVQQYFFDLSVVNLRRTDSYAPYTLADNSYPRGDIDQSRTFVTLTAGYRF